MSSWRERLTGSNPTWLDQVLRYFLRLASPLYSMAVLVRNWLYDQGLKRSFRCAIPVISIGNLSVGGTGKTPVVAWVVQWLTRRGLRVVVLSRGYRQLADGRNDEAMELEIKIPGVPHLQHWDRVASAQRAIHEFRAQVLVLDDGFQHRRLARDLDIVLLDATDSPAAQWLLPAGLRREPMSAIRRADVAMITRSDQATPAVLEQLSRSIHNYNPKAACVQSTHRASSLFIHPNRQVPLASLQDTRVFAFCGIGNPKAFFDTLESHGAILVGKRVWPDHHAYTSQDLQELAEVSRRNPKAMFICTMKDWVKIRKDTIGSFELLALCIELDMSDHDEIFEKILEKVVAGIQ